MDVPGYTNEMNNNESHLHNNDIYNQHNINSTNDGFFNESLDSLDHQTSRYIMSGQQLDMIPGNSLDDSHNKHIMLSYNNDGHHHHLPVISSKNKKAKPPLQGEEKKLYFLTKFLDHISDENLAMEYLTSFENFERIKKGSEEGDRIIATLIELKVSQRILRNVLGIGFHRYNRVLSGEPPKKKGKRPMMDGDNESFQANKRIHCSSDSSAI